MAESTTAGDLRVTGNLRPKTFSPPAGCVDNAAVKEAAGIDADKLQHQHEITAAQPNTAAADETRVVHVVHGSTAEVVAFSAGSIVAALGDATCTFDLKKNGTTILTGVVTLNSGSVAYTAQAGTIDNGDLVAGDVLEVVINATIGTGTLPTGVFASVVLREDAD